MTWLHPQFQVLFFFHSRLVHFSFPSWKLLELSQYILVSFSSEIRLIKTFNFSQNYCIFNVCAWWEYLVNNTILLIIVTMWNIQSSELIHLWLVLFDVSPFPSPLHPSTSNHHFTLFLSLTFFFLDSKSKVSLYSICFSLFNLIHLA